MKHDRIWLIDLRKKRGLTQQQVADSLTINRSTYALIESGLRNPSPDSAKQIANVLGFEWVIFFDNEWCDKKQKSGGNYPKSKAA
ncbi:helix-turn-helix transcriptional regulator [Pelosinus baikalensis]|uniref:Helix-turn-helix domain-containing protein n=1 Tax=Pelosinus baikalensis TaxID=2892015 RepID=A0ABS8HUG5_9FIRM|nr:helix-turn-helix transcriptional regulator [Pelosinus baikalensis]MCC5466805.1 helix-turn-helix domain-containing protein [Pelosinus baikalensis]